MKKLIVTFIILFVGVNVFALTIDLKVHTEDKARLSGIEIGTMYYLNNAGINVFDVGEDKAVWLELIKEESFNSSQRLTLKITITKPSLIFKNKQIFAEKTIILEIPNANVNGENINTNDTSIIQFGKQKAVDLKDQLLIDGKIGGKIIADTIIIMLHK